MLIQYPDVHSPVVRQSFVPVNIVYLCLLNTRIVKVCILFSNIMRKCIKTKMLNIHSYCVWIFKSDTLYLQIRYTYSVGFLCLRGSNTTYSFYTRFCIDFDMSPQDVLWDKIFPAQALFSFLSIHSHCIDFAYDHDHYFIFCLFYKELTSILQKIHVTVIWYLNIGVII